MSRRLYTCGLQVDETSPHNNFQSDYPTSNCLIDGLDPTSPILLSPIDFLADKASFICFISNGQCLHA